METSRYLDYINLYLIYGVWLVKLTDFSIYSFMLFSAIGAFYIKRLRYHTDFDPGEGMTWILPFIIKGILSIVFVWYVAPVIWESVPVWIELLIDLLL